MGCTQIGPMRLNSQPIRAFTQASFHGAFRQGFGENLAEVLQNLSKSWVLKVFWRTMKRPSDGVYANRADAPKFGGKSHGRID